MDMRDRPSLPPGWEADHGRMALLDGNTGEVYPAKYEVCPVCDGKGKHVNPDIDRNGLTAEDFAEDPDFAESYRSGVYDVACNGCGGRRVVLVPKHEDGKQALADAWQEDAQYRAEVAAERRMGA